MEPAGWATVLGRVEGRCALRPRPARTEPAGDEGSRDVPALCPAVHRAYGATRFRIAPISRRLRALLRALTEMDARAWRTLAVSFLLFGGVGLVFVFGAAALGLKGGAGLERWLGAGVHGPGAPLAAVAGFCLLAFLGAPQILLIAAAVVAFGPWAGAAYSWLGTEISSLVGFALGRRFGARLLRDYGGAGVNAFVDLVGRNGFWASLVVRLVPSAPFIVINMAAGVTPMGWAPFALGTGLGVVPKIALTAFAGQAVVRGVNGGAGLAHGAGLALAGAAWLGCGLAARAWIKRRERATTRDDDTLVQRSTQG